MFDLLAKGLTWLSGGEASTGAREGGATPPLRPEYTFGVSKYLAGHEPDARQQAACLEAARKGEIVDNGRELTAEELAAVDREDVDEVVSTLCGTEGVMLTDERGIVQALRGLGGDAAKIAAVRAAFEKEKGVSLETFLADSISARDGAEGAFLRKEAAAILSGDPVAAAAATLSTALASEIEGDDARDTVADALMKLTPEQRIALREQYGSWTAGEADLMEAIDDKFDFDDYTMLEELSGGDDGRVDFARASAYAIDQEVDNVVDDDDDKAFALAGKYRDAWKTQEWDTLPDEKKQGYIDALPADLKKRLEGLSPEEALERGGLMHYGHALNGSYTRELDDDGLLGEMHAGAEKERMWYFLLGDEAGVAASNLQLATMDGAVMSAGTDEQGVWGTLLDSEGVSPLEMMDFWQRKYGVDSGDAENRSGYTFGSMLTEELGGLPATEGAALDALVAEYRLAKQSGDDEKLAELEERSRVKTAALALRYGFGGDLDGTDEDVVKKALDPLTPEQIDAVALDLYPDLDVASARAALASRAGGELSGRSHTDFTADLAFGGKVTSLEDAIGKESYLYEQEGAGGLIDGLSSIFASGNTAGERMEANHAEMQELQSTLDLATTLREVGKDDEAADLELLVMDDAESILRQQGGAIDQLRAHEDSAGDVASTAAGLAALAAVSLAFPGALAFAGKLATGWGLSAATGTAAAGALASGAGGMLGKWAALGDDYSEDVGMDALTTVVSAAGAGLLNGAGAQALFEAGGDKVASLGKLLDGKVLGASMELGAGASGSLLGTLGSAGSFLGGGLAGKLADPKLMGAVVKGLGGGLFDATADLALTAASGGDTDLSSLFYGAALGGIGGVAGHGGGALGGYLGEALEGDKAMSASIGGLLGGAATGYLTAEGDFAAKIFGAAVTGAEGAAGGYLDAKTGDIADGVQSEHDDSIDVILDEIVAKGPAASDANLHKLENQPILYPPEHSPFAHYVDGPDPFMPGTDTTIPDVPAGPSPFEASLGALGFGDLVTKSGTDALGTPVSYQSAEWVDEYFGAVAAMEGYAASQGSDAKTARGKEAYDLLSPEEWMALHIYTGDSYPSINAGLRGSDPGAGKPGHGVDDYLSQIQAFVDVAVGGMDKLPVFDDPTIRGTSMKDAIFQQYVDAQAAGAPIVGDKAFMSTSTDPHVADDFKTMTAKPGSTPVIMEIDAGHTGRQLDFLSSYENEAEVLMPPGMATLVKQIVDMGTYKVIQLAAAQEESK